MLRSIRQLDYVVLLCRDVEKMKRFYHEVMELPLRVEQPDWIELQAGSVLLTLRRRGRAYDGAGSAPDAADVQLAFRVSPGGVDECHRQLLERGVEIVEPPSNKPFGHRTVFFRDPEGNVIEIYAEL